MRRAKRRQQGRVTARRRRPVFRSGHRRRRASPLVVPPRRQTRRGWGRRRPTNRRSRLRMRIKGPGPRARALPLVRARERLLAGSTSERTRARLLPSPDRRARGARPSQRRRRGDSPSLLQSCLAPRNQARPSPLVQRTARRRGGQACLDLENLRKRSRRTSRGARKMLERSSPVRVGKGAYGRLQWRGALGLVKISCQAAPTRLRWGVRRTAKQRARIYLSSARRRETQAPRPPRPPPPERLEGPLGDRTTHLLSDQRPATRNRKAPSLRLEDHRAVRRRLLARRHSPPHRELALGLRWIPAPIPLRHRRERRGETPRRACSRSRGQRRPSRTPARAGARACLVSEEAQVRAPLHRVVGRRDSDQAPRGCLARAHRPGPVAPLSVAWARPRPRLAPRAEVALLTRSPPVGVPAA
mmetsp:Transcript_4843/g.13563  ORF Transcript_4843/g.13563 Transcript_4843/m.13563 type:complete len:415 (-) Transcript_4843:381-1625(-)